LEGNRPVIDTGRPRQKPSERRGPREEHGGAEDFWEVEPADSLFQMNGPSRGTNPVWWK